MAGYPAELVLSLVDGGWDGEGAGATGIVAAFGRGGAKGALNHQSVFAVVVPSLSDTVLKAWDCASLSFCDLVV